MLSNWLNKIVLVTVFLAGFLFGNTTLGATVVSPFNKLPLFEDSLSNYKFIITGHLHGASTNASGYPASSVLANIDHINELNAAFIISLGDIYVDVTDRTISNYNRSFFSKLKTPFFNSVGNHDLSGNLYKKIFGDLTYYKFRKGSTLFIALNSEENDGNIEGSQFDFFVREIKSFSEDSSLRNVFIFSHRPIWAEGDEKYNNLFQGNTRTSIGTNNFNKEVLPVLSSVGKNKEIFWVSGSLGGTAPASFFYDKRDNITYMATAIRDLPRDAILEVEINQGKVKFSGISLNADKIEPIESYNLKYWTDRVKKAPSFNYRLLPYYTIQMITHYYFWIGLVFGCCVLMIILWVLKFLSKR